ncbi:MAG TPA: DUF2752 domain-containing protein [Bacteroidia bacterium]|nr:DUF2752 domain-containing protein [Bacteroidia bacterium]
MKKSKAKIWLMVLGIIPVVLLILPADFFDKGQSICISVLLLHRTCPGCGMTRAVQHLIHLDFQTAFMYNKAIVIVFPLMVYLYSKEILRLLNVIKNGD